MIASLDSWWNGLELIVKIFYGIGIFATLIVAIQTVLSLIGLEGGHSDGGFDSIHDALPDGGHDAISDGGHDATHDSDQGDVSFLSFRTIIAFLAGFGWIGALMLKNGIALWLTLLAAGAVGFMLMFIIFWVMRLLWSMRESGTLDYHSAIGEIGTVYLPIPGNKEGRGQIEVMMQERLQTVQAITPKPGRIENRARVLVIDVLQDNTLVVIPDDTPTQP